jgi:hypothetical protein
LADPCFITPLGTVRGMTADVAQFGRSANSTRAVIEFDNLPAKPMAYLLRDDFAHVYLPRARSISETPSLVGDIGLGFAASGGDLATPTATLMATTRPEIRYTNGVTLHSASFTPESAVDQHVLVAINWSVDPAATPAGAVWQLNLRDMAGQTVASDTGDTPMAAELRGQRLVSAFWFDSRRQVAPAALAPGAYELALQLIDTRVTPTRALAFTSANGTGAAAFTLPVTIAEHQRCDL